MEKGPPSWLEFSSLSSYPELIHASFSRQGGVSKPPFNSLNVSSSVGDTPKAVLSNRETIKKLLSLPTVIYGKQVHGNEIYRVRGKQEIVPPPGDALVTTERGVALAIAHADCQAALFYDPVQEAIAAVHSGWRGSVLNIYQQVITFMEEELGTKPRDLVVSVAPSLCPDHFEMKYYKKELPSHFWPFQTREHHFDFRAITQMQLEEAGVGQIEISSLCTYCNESDFFSYRRDKKTGRNGTLIALKEEH